MVNLKIKSKFNLKFLLNKHFLKNVWVILVALCKKYSWDILSKAACK